MATHFCRVCLTCNVRMHRIDSNGLQEMFEKVTNTKLYTDDRPVTMCYICLPQLQKSHRFLEMCQTAEETFIDILTNGMEVNNSSLSMLNLQTIQHITISVTPTRFLTLVNDKSTNDLNVIKECVDHIVKDEIDENFETDESIVSMNCNNDSINESSNAAVKEEVDDVEKSADFDHTVKVEMYEQHFETDKSIVSMNSNNVDSQYAEGGQIVFEENVNTINIDTDKTGRRYECDFCNHKFRTKKYLMGHIKRHMKITPYSCNVCAKAYEYRYQMKQHIQIHTGERPSCSICKKTFGYSGSLQKHMRIHTGEYSCNRCKKTFVSNSGLTRHMRTHTGERPYSCNICDKAFACNSGLRIHMRKHTGEKPYACNRCDNAFYQSSDLQKHLQIHTGVKPYSCNICDKTFIRSPHLKNHMKSHTRGRTYCCNICNEAFTFSSVLKRHIKTHAGEK